MGKEELTALFSETQTVDNLPSQVNKVVLVKTIILETRLKHTHKIIIRAVNKGR